jgi:hypothetical protein
VHISDSLGVGRGVPQEKLLPPKLPCHPVFQSRSACCQALAGMLFHPLGELRRPYQAGLHRDVSDVRGGDGLLGAICGRRETTEHGDDLDHNEPPH